ncbi:hypothetical protein GCM10023156_51060 [Novipirellula rosea]|uniref:Uncharacterized protein n=1 Tax=Novipirellula rosea TaxID=1031540 RepID=A0ABP8NEG6_9BACT
MISGGEMIGRSSLLIRTIGSLASSEGFPVFSISTRGSDKFGIAVVTIDPKTMIVSLGSMGLATYFWNTVLTEGHRMLLHALPLTLMRH